MATTARDLQQEGYRPRLPNEILAEAFLSQLAGHQKKGMERHEALQAIFPATALDPEVLEATASAIVAGQNILFLGPPGSGKTSIAKAVWDLYPKQVVTVEGCPVADDPASLFDPDFARLVPPCPFCRTNHGGGEAWEPGSVQAKDVPVVRTRLREGMGLARVQGSPEVFPDNLTGSVNLARLEEIGDPESPLVLSPGKVLQANRGVLFIDEIGKLPRGTQNVLLQALQERIATPAKSRETFPASFVAVATSNLDDLDRVNEPLSGRLASIHVPFSQDRAVNRRIITVGMVREPPRPHSPTALYEAAARLMIKFRERTEGAMDLSEVGSNRTLIDIVRRARALTTLAGRSWVTPDDFVAGARDAMHSKVRARGQEAYQQNRDLVSAFLDEQGKPTLKEATNWYWCQFFDRELASDKSEGKRVLAEMLDAAEDKQAIADSLAGKRLAKLQRFAQHVAKVEGVPAEHQPERIAATIRLLRDAGAFDGA